MNATNQWEAAWEEYTDALTAFDASFPNRHRRGQMRPHNKNKTRLTRAKKVLRELDAEFCDRQGINL